MSAEVIYLMAAGIASLLTFTLGVIVCDRLAAKYWKKEISRIEGMHKAMLNTAYVDGFNSGVTSGMKSNKE